MKSNGNVVCFSRMYQAVTHLSQVARVMPSTFVTTRRSTLKAFRHNYPDLHCALAPRFLGALSKGGRLLRNADLIVTGSPYKDFLAQYSAKKVNVFHGTFSRLSRDYILEHLHFDLVCVIGPRMLQMFKRHPESESMNLVQTGYLPFCQFPEQSSEHKIEVLSRMGLNPEKKTVVYTSARRNSSSWKYVARQLILTAPKEFNLILRPHPSQALTPRSADRKSFLDLTKLIGERPGAYLDLGYQHLADLLSVTDMVISDANSPSEESMFYDVPQLFIETEKLSKDVSRRVGLDSGMHPDDVERMLTLYDCGERLFVKTPPDFSRLLDKTTESAYLYSKQRKTYFEWVFGSRDRLANHRVVEAINQI